MKITQVRNATILLEAGGQRVLVDPMFGAKGSFGPAPTSVGDSSRNPTVDLTVPLNDLLDVDVVVVTHTHPDHWDAAAAALLPREVPLLVQNTGDAEIIAAEGFTDVRVMDEPVEVGGTEFVRTDGQHGSDATVAAWPRLGEVSGVVVRRSGEPTVYVAGDTVWNEHVREALEEHQPDIVVLNTGEATWQDGSPIIMGAADVLEVHRTAPQARIVAVHMQALNHCVVTRDDVRELARRHGIARQVLVPEDGEALTF